VVHLLEDAGGLLLGFVHDVELELVVHVLVQLELHLVEAEVVHLQEQLVLGGHGCVLTLLQTQVEVDLGLLHLLHLEHILVEEVLEFVEVVGGHLVEAARDLLGRGGLESVHHRHHDASDDVHVPPALRLVDCVDGLLAVFEEGFSRVDFDQRVRLHLLHDLCFAQNHESAPVLVGRQLVQRVQLLRALQPAFVLGHTLAQDMLVKHEQSELLEQGLHVVVVLVLAFGLQEGDSVVHELHKQLGVDESAGLLEFALVAVHLAEPEQGQH